MTRSEIRIQNPESRRAFWLAIGILLAAAAFRFLAVDAVPPGWRDDELIEFGLDQRIVQGWRPLFITEAEGHEPFYHYLHAGTIALFGENIIGYKWLPFAFGLLTVVLTYALAHRMFDARVALLAAALMAVSFWPIIYARLGLRHIGILPLMLGAFYLLYPSPTPAAASAWKGEGALPRPLRERAKGEGRILVSGLLLAAALMTYFAGRAPPVILIGFLIYVLLFHRSLFRQVWIGIPGAVVLAGIVAAPMFIQIANTPGAEKRTEVVGGPLIAAQHGDLRPALETTLGTLGMFTFGGDPESLYNVSSRPVFDWLTGSAFYLGVLACLVRLRRVESAFALIWLAVGIAPAFVSLPAASFSHTLAAQPVVYVLTAVGATEVVAVVRSLTERMRDREKEGHAPSLRLSISLSLIPIGLIIIGALLTVRDYFGTWANDPFVRFQYHAPTRNIGRWLDQHPEVTDVAIGTHPNELWLDPVALQLDLKRRDVKARWFDPASALVLPRDGVIITSPMQPHTDTIQGVTSQVAGCSLARFPSGPTEPALTFYRVGCDTAVQTIQPQPIFDKSIKLVGTLRDLFDSPHRGERITRTLAWQLVSTLPNSRFKLFAHMLDSKNQVIAANDRLDVNLDSLTLDDRFAQIVTFEIPKNFAPGEYPVEVGWYNPDTGERLKSDNGSDHYLLRPIEVIAK